MNNWKLFLDTNLKFILYLENCSYNTILPDLSIYEIPVGVLVYCKIMSHSICNCKFYITDYRYSVLRRIDSIIANSNRSEKLISVIQEKYSFLAVLYDQCDRFDWVSSLFDHFNVRALIDWILCLSDLSVKTRLTNWSNIDTEHAQLIEFVFVFD